MDNEIHARYTAEDRSYLSIIKKEIHSVCKSLEFSEHRLGEIDIIVAELCSNLIKHAGGRGEILFKITGQEKANGIEIISIDSGPGIEHAAEKIKDGFSSTNTLGHGLGAISRLADFFEMYSIPGWGSIFLCRMHLLPAAASKAADPVQFRSVVVPKNGEIFCGDGFCTKQLASTTMIMIADGLGHGPEARLAVKTAADVFKTCQEKEPVEILRELHTGIKKTRGMVATVICYDAAEKKFSIAGVGNISSRFYSPVAKNLMSYNGIVGMNMPTSMNNQEMDIENAQLLIICSDGIKSRWDGSKYPLIAKYDLSILAAAIYKDYARRTDDMSVYVMRLK